MLAVADETPWVWNVLFLLTVPAMVGLNGVFVAAEFALVAVRRTRVQQIVNEGVPGAEFNETARASLNRAIAATQLGITLASIGLGFVGEPALARLLDRLFEQLPEGWRAFATHSVAFTIAFLLITFMHVVFGELLPKTMTL